MKINQEWCEWVMKRVALAGPLPKDYAEVDLAFMWVSQHLTVAQLVPWMESNVINRHYTWTQTRDETVTGRTYDLLLHIWNKGDATFPSRGYNGDGDLLQKMYDCLTVPDSHPDDVPSPICRKSLWDHYICSKPEILAVKHRRIMFEEHLDTFITRGARSLLDLGSGNGSYARHAYQRLQDSTDSTFGPVVAMDMHYLPVAEYPGPMYIRRDVITNIPEQPVDIVYSGGLFDYFNDRIFKKVLANVRDLHPQFIMIGNFEQSPTMKLIMHCLDWHLFDRSRWDLLELASNVFSGAKSIDVVTDPTKCQHFLMVELDR